MKVLSSQNAKHLRQVFLSLLILSIASFSIRAQAGITIQVNGNQIIGPCGDTLLLRGVNYAPYNWGWSPAELNLSEIALSGSNCVRLPWYAAGSGSTPSMTYADFVMLDSVLSQCVANDLIPILELHDQTCQNSSSALTTLANWFVQQPILDLIEKYKHSLILNIANEALYVNWTADPAASQSVFVNTYSGIVSTLRANGITVPILIDGPDCGTNLDVLTSVGSTLQAADPINNLIFSAHAYWYAYAGNDSSTYQAKIDNALASGIPFLFGEIANLQDDQILCQYTLNYQPLLNICQANGIGWLAWSWDRDGCPDRQITTNGSISSLSTYGADILNNPGYGLIPHAPARSSFLVNGSCSPQTGLGQIHNFQSVTLFPNPGQGQVSIRLAEPSEHLHVSVHDLLGKQILTKEFMAITEVQLALPNRPGLYFVSFRDDQGWKSVERLWVQ